MPRARAQPSFISPTFRHPTASIQFGLMHRELTNRGWNFGVWFMSPSEPRREWKFTRSDFDMPHRFLRGRHLRIGEDAVYFNRELPRLLHKTRLDVLLVADAWIHPSV